MKPWWVEDCKLLAAVVNAHSTLNVDGTIIIQELDGKLTECYVSAPTGDEATVLVESALQTYRLHGRIAKNSPRAVLCKHCTIKRACDATDLERGETSDWPSNYQVG